MPTPKPPKPNAKPNSKDDEDLDDTDTVIEGPPEEDFDDKYNKHLEAPISIVSAIFVHVFLGAVVIFVLLRLMAGGEDKSGVPVKLVDLQGLDDGGEGSAGSGGIDDPFFKADGDPVKSAIDSLQDPSKLPEIKEDMRQALKYLDPTGNMPISDANAAAYKSLNESVAKKLMGVRQGSGPGEGSGYDGSKGKGPGGTGADSTLGRNMRWVLRFRVNSGRDYLDQLKAMGAELLVPIPGTENCILIADINNPKDQRPATDEDMRQLSAGNKIKFSDSRREAVRGVAETLGLNFSPTSFWAFFPKSIEEDLEKKEKSFRNRRPEDIEETIFRVSVRGGSYELLVDEQKIKK